MKSPFWLNVCIIIKYCKLKVIPSDSTPSLLLHLRREVFTGNWETCLMLELPTWVTLKGVYVNSGDRNKLCCSHLELSAVRRQRVGDQSFPTPLSS